jgi:hypothetical protein
MRVKVSVWWLGAALCVFGCGSSADEDTDLEDGCDIRTEGCQRATFAAAVRIRGQPGLRMPPVRTITLDQFEAMLEEESPEPEQDPWDTALVLLGLLPRDSSANEAYAASSAANVAAFYDHETKDVTIIDRGTSDPLDDVYVLAHEFAHFLQDAERPLGDFQDQWIDSVDSYVAVTALIEGEANVVGIGVVGEALGSTLDQFNWDLANASLRDGAFEAIESSPAPFITALQILPYPLGTAQVAPLWLRAGKGALAPLYEAPPLSALDWAEDTLVTAASRVQPLDCEPSAGPPGFVGSGRDSFGPAAVFAVQLAGGAGTKSAWSAALGFRGDRVVLFEEDGVPGSYAVAWRVRFQDEAAATAFQASVERVLAAGASLVEEREVVLMATSDEAKLAPWLEVMHCGTPEELPQLPVEPAEENSALRRKLARGRAHDLR